MTIDEIRKVAEDVSAGRGAYTPQDMARALKTAVVLVEEAERLTAERDHYRRRKDEAYTERNRVVAALSKCFPAGRTKTDISGWDPEWHGCVYIDLPTGQVSWHFHDDDAHLFEHLPPYSGEWDGHDTPEKYRRLSMLEAEKPKAKKVRVP